MQDEGKHIHTGVTAVFPHEENLFKEKVPAAVSVINGFGKSVGLIQIEELGNIETPILMTNTFGVGTALNALTRYMLEQNRDIGVTTCTVNGVVTECNDGELNDIRGMHLTEADVCKALETAGAEFGHERRDRICIQNSGDRRKEIYDWGYRHVKFWSFWKPTH